MRWRNFDALMFLLGVGMLFAYFTFDFSVVLEPATMKAVLLSIIVGVWIYLIFVFFAGIGLPTISDIKRIKEDEKEEKLHEHAKIYIKKIIRKKRRNHIIGIILMIIVILGFLNFYLYFKAMLGNDMLVSLKVDNSNFIIKNGEVKEFNVKAKVISNPFCEANCSIILKDLSNENIIDYENFYLKVSSPLYKNYYISSNEEVFGQRLYKIILECNTIKNRFCYASTFAQTNTSNSRTSIISVDYQLNSVQEIRKQQLKNKTQELNNIFYSSHDRVKSLEMNFPYLDLSELEKERTYIITASYIFSNKINKINDLYLNQNYSELEKEITNVNIGILDFENRVNVLDNSINKTLEKYNYLIENARLMHDEIYYLQDYNFTNYSIIIAEEFINDFNLMIEKLNQKNLIQTKEISFNYIDNKKKELFIILENESINGIIGENKINISITYFNLSKLTINESNYSSYFTISDPYPICCFRNECYKCIQNSLVNYPIVFVHGHSFNEKLSAELSLESFSDMARELEKQGYLNGGYFYGSQYEEISQGYLGKINNSVVVEATYYLDTLTTEQGDFIYDSKWESIDTYAERLNEIVSNVKYLTGKDKVIIVAHSMGGLVTRKYLQVYGSENVDRVILIGIPNKGVDGFVLDYCPVFGADIECNEMNKNSLFIFELNKKPIPNIPIYNIIGLGCYWEGSIGDGIVKNESAFLPGAENIYVNGICKGVDFYHVNMIKPSKYPEIYEIIKEKIKQ